MKNVCVIFGGKSVESDVSVVTAKQVIQNFDFAKYKMIPVYIDKKGRFWSGKEYDKVATFKDFNPKKHKAVTFGGGVQGFWIGKKFVHIDCALICCHGTGGEDGSLQGLLNMVDIPYTCSSVEASAICMNKWSSKKYFQFLGLPITNFKVLVKGQDYEIENLTKGMKYPLFVKPANLGSSVGISKCKNLDDLKSAIEIAFCFDNTVIIEQGVENLIEYNCSTMKVDGQIISSQIESPHAWSDFLNFDDKYLKKGKKLCKKVNKTKIGKRLEKQIKQMAIFVHKEFGLEGVIRTDFLYDSQNKKLYINEINTIPGSLAFYLYKQQGFSFKDILNNLVEDALQRYEYDKNKTTNFDSNILANK